MTEKLKQVLHAHASAPQFAPVDLDALVADGDRRVRRRRWSGAAAGAAVVAGAVVAGILVSGSGSDSRTIQPAEDPAGSGRQVTWSTGSVIHEGDASIDVGHVVDAYVETSRGYVFADPGGTVYSVNGGEVTEIGTTPTKGMHLVSDPDNPYAGWVEVHDGHPGFMIHDQGSRTTTRVDEHTRPGQNTIRDTDDPAYFYAIDDTTAYWRDERGAVAVSVKDGSLLRVVDAEARNGFAIAAAENSVLAFPGDGTLIGPSPDRSVRLPEVYGSIGAFSPGALYYSSDADEPSVWDLTSRERVDVPGLADYGFAAGFSWLDEATLVFIAMADPEGDRIELVSCEIPVGACETATEFGTGETFRIPVGTSFE